MHLHNVLHDFQSHSHAGRDCRICIAGYERLKNMLQQSGIYSFSGIRHRNAAERFLIELLPFYRETDFSSFGCVFKGIRNQILNDR